MMIVGINMRVFLRGLSNFARKYSFLVVHNLYIRQANIDVTLVHIILRSFQIPHRKS